jgi:SRSO17 transposase
MRASSSCLFRGPRGGGKCRGDGGRGAPVRSHLRRPEARCHTVDYLRGLIDKDERKNGWQLAEYAVYAHPRVIQRVLAPYSWNADESVRDHLRRWVVAERGDPRGLLVADETGFPKQGRHSAGMVRHYSATLGKIGNCQVGVFLGYATARGHVGLHRALLLPQPSLIARDVD